MQLLHSHIASLHGRYEPRNDPECGTMLFLLLLMDVFQKVITMVHEYVQGEDFEEDDAGPQAGFEEEDSTATSRLP